MDAHVIDKVEEAIDIWFDRAEGKINETPCPLCELTKYGCKGCPVNDVTSSGCIGTPYHNWYSYMMGSGPQSRGAKEEAKKEVHFLISLLPEKLQKPYWHYE